MTAHIEDVELEDVGGGGPVGRDLGAESGDELHEDVVRQLVGGAASQQLPDVEPRDLPAKAKDTHTHTHTHLSLIHI